MLPPPSAKISGDGGTPTASKGMSTKTKVLIVIGIVAGALIARHYYIKRKRKAEEKANSNNPES